ncbi:MAG: hypothetical protein IPH06_13670 [Alphaproteobacteria bacterium]|nr:hypothetical protein [Alphaproteobacteria bacterium]
MQYSYDSKRSAPLQVWEFVLDQIVSAKSADEVPTLDELRRRVKDGGLL